jgi:hypothetical protein
MAQHEPTISSILQELAEEYHTIVNERTLCERVLERRPSQAKDPYASIRDKLRWDGTHVGWIRLGGGDVIPLRILREGLTFRVIPDDEEYRTDQISRFRCAPFINVYDAHIRLEDEAGRAIDAKPLALRDPNYVPHNAKISLGDWFRRSGFEQGDSILVTIQSHTPLTLRLEREPMAAFRADDVLQHEHDLLEEVARLVARTRTNLISAEELILPIYARASWRTGYPSRPWQMLVENDRRLRLVDELFVASSSFRRPIDFLLEPEADQERDDNDAQLLTEIQEFQSQVMTSRRSDAAQGIWDGRAPRASTARVIFDTQAGTSTVVYLEPIDSLADHQSAIEENLAQGGYDDEGWENALDDDDDDDDFEGFDGLDFDRLDQIDDLQEFMIENPQLAEAAQKLMAALTPEELERLQNTESTEEAQQILAQRFHRMLPSDPSLFGTLAPYTIDLNEHNEGSPLNGPGHANGNSNGQQAETSAIGELLDDWEDEDDWDALSAEHVPGESVASREALARSNELMERFYQYLRGQGKSEATATSRTSDLWVYADFLANYYSRGLAEGDYATLDECMFFFYPRKILNSSPRAAREMCTSIKQFYAFLRAHSTVDDSFAQAIWRRRDQAARVVELYEYIDGDSPQFERLFAHLFAPYTV